MNARIFFWALTAALAGFLFGFDTVVISGAEQKIQSLWGLTAGMQGIAMGSALYGTVLGALIGGWPTDRLGRKSTLLWIGLLYVVSAFGTALAPNVSIFIFARMIGGFGIGISTVVSPLYISEIAPPKYRGRLAGMFQFNIVFGILVAYLSNALLAGTGENAWRWMLGVAAIPSLLYTIFSFGIPESPRWLLTRKNDRAGEWQFSSSFNQTPRRLRSRPGRMKSSRPAARSEDSSGNFWNMATANSDSAGVFHCVF